MGQLFDAYIMVDWSAAARPVQGVNSIWIGELIRQRPGQLRYRADNPATRLAARRALSATLSKLTQSGQRVLVGFDFALGYPAGTAAALGLDTSKLEPWAALHAYLAEEVHEAEDNANTRFALAAAMNKTISAGPYPFWGAPPSQACDTLQPRKGDFSLHPTLAEHRRAEAWIRINFKAHPKSVWQLLGAGAVGSQALLGIATVHALRRDLAGSRLWPFETGFKSLTPADIGPGQCLFAEVYPSTILPGPKPGEVHDAAQVRSLAHHLESLDSAGQLGPAFGPQEGLNPTEISQIEIEEGWILAK